MQDKKIEILSSKKERTSKKQEKKNYWAKKIKGSENEQKKRNK